MPHDRFFDTHTNITLTVPKEVAKTSKEGKALLNSFFQFLVDAGMYENMQQFADWDKVKPILEALE